MYCWPKSGAAGIGGHMKHHIGRWLLGLAMMVGFAGAYTATPAAAAETNISVNIGHRHHRHGHYVVYYRYGHRYRVYRYY